MRHSVSDTAEFGDYASGPRVVNDATRREMARILGEIRSGEFARRWVGEDAAGRPWFEGRRRAERSHPIEAVGGRLRAMMPFLDAVEVSPEGDLRAAAEVAVAGGGR